MKYILIVIFIIPAIVFAQINNQAATSSQELPSTLGGLKLMWQNFKEKGPTIFIEGIKQSFNQTTIIWRKIHLKIVNWWQGSILPKIKGWFSKEVEQRKPILEEEFEKEKKETGEELKEFKNKVFEFYQFLKQKFFKK